MGTRVLFVDDEARVLQGLQRVLRSLRLDWDVTFATGAADALDRLDAVVFDVVVSDMRMPDISGAQLLEEVRRRQPEAIRFILSGQSSEESVLSSVGPAHQYLAKPCDPAFLIAAIRRAVALRAVLRDPDLQRLITQVGVLPSAPELYLRLVSELRSPSVSVQHVADMVSEDVGMSAKILQLVNSAFFGLQRRVSDPQQAVSLLGLGTVAALVLSVKVFGQFDGHRLHAIELNGQAAHGLAVATWARAITRAEHASLQVQDEAFTAALLHDVGKLVLAAHLSENYVEVVDRVARDACPLCTAEREACGADHAQVGAYLLGLWGFPDAVVEAIAYHHEPLRSENNVFAPLTAVHAADALMHEAHPGRCIGPPPMMSAEYVDQVGCSASVVAWRSLDPAR